MAAHILEVHELRNFQVDEDVMAPARAPQLEPEGLHEPTHVREGDVRDVATSEARKQPPWIHATTLPASADELTGDLGCEDPGMDQFEPSAERHHFACPPQRGRFRDLDLSFLNPADPDDRHFLILSEHPELARAIERGEEEIVIGGERMNPRLHITIHELIANQLWDDDPPEVWQTARRLLAAGYERHDVLHMLAEAAAQELRHVLHEHAPFDRNRYVHALERLS